jgi:Iron-containing redox enzyme
MSALAEASISGATRADSLHRSLSRFNRKRLDPALPQEHWSEALTEEVRFRSMEREWIDRERENVASRAATAPTDADGFIQWFEDLKETGPGQGDPLFPWLATEATRDQMRWFLSQEVAGEAGFDDLVALTQLKLPVQAKLELGRNYWDELGRGNEAGMHGPMLSRLAREIGVEEDPDSIVWEARALSNLLIALAAARDYAYQSVGALGVVELTAPGRAHLVNLGLKRLRFSPVARRYYALHATLDVKHSEDWNREVLHPLVSSSPLLARPIAEGALMRLEAGRRCFERYRQHFGI